MRVPRSGLLVLLVLWLQAAYGGAFGQQPERPRPRIVWVSAFPLSQVESYVRAFRDGLVAQGYVEGKDIEFIGKSSDGDPGKMPGVISEVLALQPDVIIAQGAAVFPLKAVTHIPIVFGFSGDPVAAGLTDSWSHPSRNFTGVSFMAVELNAKRLDLIRMSLPNARRVSLIGDPIHPGVDLEIAASEAMAKQLGIELTWLATRNAGEVTDVLEKLARNPPDALVVLPDSVMLQTRQQVALFAARHRIPAISGWSVFAESGGFLTFGPRLPESFKRLAYYAARLLKGAKPSELPVERPTRFELVLNLNTARQIGLAPPPALTVLADEVID